MEIDKSAILHLLRSEGPSDKAELAATSLPDRVSTDTHADLLARLGVDPQELIEFAAGKAEGAFGGLLGHK